VSSAIVGVYPFVQLGNVIGKGPKPSQSELVVESFPYPKRCSQWPSAW